MISTAVLPQGLSTKRSGGYSWDARKGVYVSNWTGKPVKAETVRKAVLQGNEYVRRSLNTATTDLINGRTTIAQWQNQVATEIKSAWATSMRVGAGPPLSASQRGKIGNRLRQEYKYLDGFANDIAAGKLTEAQIYMRMDLYADATMVPYHMGVQDAKAQAGLREARRVLGAAEHCPDCLALAGIWMPLAECPVPGEASQCGRRCQCTMEFR